MSEYRHEYKYLCSRQQIEYVKNRVEPFMEFDPHAGAGGYTVRSLYLDDYHNQCYLDNQDGVDPREKIRIRIYNGKTDMIRLEVKQKKSGKTKKLSCPLSEELCRDIIEGKILDIRAVDSPVYRKFYLQYTMRMLRPAVIVEYDRIPYIYRDGNVRVTMDMNIRSGSNVREFLDERITTRPILPVNTHLMEVKFDEYLPDVIYEEATLKDLKQTTFSKYYLCRKYNQRGKL